MERSETDVVRAYNEAINSADLDGLRALMSHGHRFVDSAGRVVEGRDACCSAWTAFFQSFPDYRNVFESVEVVAPGQVVVNGRSECPFEPLDGPARWYASVAEGLIVEWRVEDPAERS